MSDHMDEIRERHKDAIERFGGYYEPRGFCGLPHLVIRNQSFALHYDPYEYDDERREWVGIMLAAALKNLVDKHTKALRAENERLREPVTVKPLAWEDFSERSSKATAMLLTSYMVQRWSCGRFDLSISAPGYSTGLEGAGGFYDTMDAAKAAAQADFESRIRAALETKKGPGD